MGPSHYRGLQHDYLFAALGGLRAPSSKAGGPEAAKRLLAQGSSHFEVTVSNGELQPGGQATGTISLTVPAPSDGSW